MDNSVTKRKVVKRLDFENCEITTVKMRKKFRKRLKAKITSEYVEDVTESSPQSQNNPSPIHVNANEDSPILSGKHSARKRTDEIASPVLVKKRTCKKRSFREKPNVLESTNQCFPSTSSSPVMNPSSPVLLFKHCGRMKKRKVKGDSEVKDFVVSKRGEIIQESPDRTGRVQIQLFSSPYSCPEVLIDDDDKDYICNRTCDIEEFTPQELAKVRISSSESRAPSDVISENQSREENDIPSFKTPEKDETEAEASALDSGRKRKRHKKGGLVARLINLRQRQASERRIREHKKKIMKAEEEWKKTLQVLEYWVDGTRLLLKCQELPAAQQVTPVTKGNMYMILSKDSGNCIWKIKEGTLLRIAAPWQELTVFEANILLNVTSVELIDDIPGFLVPKTEMCRIPVSRYKEDEASLFSALLSLENDVFFGDIIA